MSIDRTRNPFLSLLPKERVILLLVYLFTTLTTCILALINNYAGSDIVLLSFLFYAFCASLPLIVYKERKHGIFHPLIFMCLWDSTRTFFVGFIPMTMSGLTTHRAIHGFSVSDFSNAIGQLFLLEGFALVFSYIGVSYGFRIRVPTWNLGVNSNQRAPKHIRVKALILSGFALYGLYVLITAAGGIEQLLWQRSIRADERVSAVLGGQFSFLANTGVIIPIVWAAVDRDCFRKVTFWFMVFISSLFPFVASGSRSHVILGILVILATYAIRHRVFSLWKVSIIALILLAFLGIAGDFRSATRSASTLQTIDVETGFFAGVRSSIDELGRRAGENNGSIAILARTPSEVPHIFGESYLSMPFVFVPRAIWPFDYYPRAGGQLVIERFYGREVGGVPPGRVGEAYWNFSYMGIPIVFTIYGFVMGWVGKFYARNPESPIASLLLVIFLFRFSPTSNGFYDLMHVLIPALIFLFIIKMRIPKRMKSRRHA